MGGRKLKTIRCAPETKYFPSSQEHPPPQHSFKYQCRTVIGYRMLPLLLLCLVATAVSFDCTQPKDSGSVCSGSQAARAFYFDTRTSKFKENIWRIGKKKNESALLFITFFCKFWMHCIQNLKNLQKLQIAELSPLATCMFSIKLICDRARLLTDRRSKDFCELCFVQFMGVREKIAIALHWTEHVALKWARTHLR